MNAELTTIALAGLGGFGQNYVNALLKEGTHRPFQFVAGIDPQPSRSQRIDEIRHRGIRIYDSIEAFYQSGSTADLMVLCTPPHLHAEQTVAALKAGSHVLCEKPLGGHPDQVQQMISARDHFRQARLQVAIGYQWSFSRAIQSLKRDTIEGRWGHPLRLCSKIYWPRGLAYYSRNAWAGRIHDDQGRWVLDSPANNACAHYLHNMFYVLGPTIDRSAWPATVRAELYRANAIENYDSAVIHCTTGGSNPAELLLVVSHATQHPCEPVFSYEFEKATIHHGGMFGEEIVAIGIDGSRHSYGNPSPSDSPEKLWEVLASIRSGRLVVCGPEAAGAQTAAIFAAQQSMDPIVDVPESAIRCDDHRRYVGGLDSALNRCYDEFIMPSACELSWTRPGRVVSVETPSWLSIA